MSVFRELHEHAERSFDEARMLPLAAYTSDEVLRCEVDDLFAHDWLCVGRTADVPRVGDYITADVPWSDGSPRSLIVLRSDDDEVTAFDNVCVHRGARLLDGCGNEPRITCPYHAWVYRLDGSLAGAPHMSTPERDGRSFDPSEHRLVALRTEVWEGFVFVNQDAAAAPLAPALAGLRDVVGRYDTAGYVPVHEQVDVWATNWKLLVENFMDAYHVFKVHRNSFGAAGDHTRDTVLFPGTEHWAHHTVVEAHGPDLAHAANERLLDAWRRTIVLAAVFPGFVVQLQPDWLWFLRITPIGTDRVRIAWQVAIAPEVLGDVDDHSGHVHELMSLIHLVNSEDRPIVEGIRRSLHRPQFDRAPMSHLERNVFDFDRYVSRRLGSG
jgi:phenylpropionate dioxygenase-like ring-hydroxylating dioxygenase large terminal subunit